MKTVSNQDLAARLDHLDEKVHEALRELGEVTAFIRANKPLVDRAAALADPAARIRGMLPGGRKAKSAKD